MIEIRTLGTLDVRGPGEATDPAAILSRPKRAAVLAYLACARPYGPRRRDELLGMFWPEVEQEKAGRALNQSVYVLRSVIGVDAISTRGNEIGLDPGLVWTDVVAFAAALGAADARAAIELHRGEFLHGFHLSGAHDFERWLDREREHYRRRVIDAAVRLATDEEAAGKPTEAIRWLRHAVEISPYEERVLQRLLGLLVERGDHANAARELDRFSRRLRGELGVEVSAETQELVRRLPRVGADELTATDRDQADTARAQRRVGSDETGPTPPFGAGNPRESGTARKRRRAPGAWRRIVPATLAVAGIVAVGAHAWLGPSDAALADRTRVLVAALENRTGDPSLDRLGLIAADWISRGLIETGLLEVVPGSVRGDDRERWAEIGEATGAELIVTGSLQRDGGDVILSALVLDVESGTLLRSPEPVAAPDSAPLAAIEELRRRTAGALATVVDTRMAAWADVASQPPSFESYRVYAEGLELLENERYLEAAERFLEAAAQDSTFTSAMVWAIEAYSLTDEGPRDSLALALAPKRDRLAPWDRAMLDHHLARIRGDLRGEYEALRNLVRLSPTGQWQVLLAQQALWLNRPTEAARILADVEPGSVQGIPERKWWGTGLESLHMRGMYAEELDRVRRWREASPRLPGYAELAELRALAGVGRSEEVLRRVEDEPRFRRWTWQTADRLRSLALELRVHGHPEAASDVLNRVFELYEAAPDSVRRDPQARRQLGRSLFTAGRWAESRAVFEELLAEGHEPHVARGDLAVAAAALGERALAEDADRFYAEMAAANPTDNGWATQWRARIAALLGDRDRAVRLLARAHEEGWPHWSWDHLVEEYDALRGYEPFEEVMRPRG